MQITIIATIEMELEAVEFLKPEQHMFLLASTVEEAIRMMVICEPRVQVYRNDQIGRA